MERLIPLLNERHDLEWVLGSSIDNGDYLFVKGDKENKFYEEQIISKKFGFIKWLVENDKIDFEGMSGHANIIKYLRDVKKCNQNQIKEGVVLMLLAIQDEPIRFLCEIIK